MHKICEYIDDELMELEQKVEKGGKLSAGEVEYGDKLAHFKKSLLTNEAMENNYSEEGGSYARGRGVRNRSYRSYDNSYDSYDGDMSEARGRNARRDSMGRYSRDGFVDKLMEMRESAPNEKSRRAVEKMIDELEN
jgi:hypothetical protein